MDYESDMLGLDHAWYFIGTRLIFVVIKLHASFSPTVNTIHPSAGYLV